MSESPLPLEKEKWGIPYVDSERTSINTVLSRPEFPMTPNNSDKIGLQMLPKQRKRLCEKVGYDFNIMTLGSQGCGKTTFINSLFKENILESAPANNGLFQVHRAQLIEDAFTLRLQIIEVNTSNEMYSGRNGTKSETKKYLEEHFKSYMFQEEQPDRSQLVDGRIHLCIFFLQPIGNTISNKELMLMKLICDSVNIIPVLSKCDTYTRQDRGLIKKRFVEAVVDEEINICDFLVDQSVLDNVKASMPFMLIASNEIVVTPDGRSVRGRRYDWGVAETENFDHCDLPNLRNIILIENTLEFIMSTKQHYEKYRKSALIRRFNAAQEAVSEVSIHQDDNLSFSEHETIINQNSKLPRYSEDSGMSGIEELQIFHRCTPKETENTTTESDDLLCEVESRIKFQYSSMSKEQDQRFREWRRSLQDRQNVFNEKLKSLTEKQYGLEIEIEKLEKGMVKL